MRVFCLFSIRRKPVSLSTHSGADLGGGAGGPILPSGIRPPANPKCTFFFGNF